MQIIKTGIPVAVTALLFSTATGARADDTLATTTTTTTTYTEPTTVTTTAPDSVLYFRTVPTTTLVTTIEGRRKDLEKAIDDARGRGDISEDQARAMKQELRRIGQETGTSTISYPTAVMLAEDLDLIGTQYRTFVTTAPVYVPIITGSTFTVSTGQTYQLDDLSVRRADLEARITKNLLRGKLTDSRAADLRTQLASIGNEANVYLANGNFDPKESKRLYTQFDHVATEIDRSAGKEKDTDIQ